MNEKETDIILPTKLLEEMEETEVSRTLTQKVKIALIAHFVNAVPIDRLNIDKRTKERFAMVDHVYWIFRKNPLLDTRAMFYQLAKQHYSDNYNNRGTSYALSKALDQMLEFVIDQVKPDSRRRDEWKVRHVADRLMERGLATDNDRAMAKGAELLTRVARLEQPESEQVDMASIAFLPTVLTTNIHEVDESREEITDEETQKIMAKYNAFVDEKHKSIEEKVAIMEARGSISPTPPEE